MKVWIDILTPKELLFFEPIMERLGGDHDILSTSRRYGEIEGLAGIRNVRLAYVGRHGGESKAGKLRASISRMAKLEARIRGFSPDVVISFCSPEAARISYGLGIKHVAFSDSPHHEAAMRLTLPLVQHLLIPRIIPKAAFSRYGIDKDRIIQYNAIDGAVLSRRDTAKGGRLPFRKGSVRNILIRIEEEEAAYVSKSAMTMPMIERVVADFGGENIVVLARYSNQARSLKEKFGQSIRVIRMSFDGKSLLEETDVFIGSGGTMTAEAALMGIPTISYNAAPNIVEEYLVRKRIIVRETEPAEISRAVGTAFSDGGRAQKRRAEKMMRDMEDPMERLYALIRS